MKKKIYVAGAIESNSIITSLENLRRGQRSSFLIMQMGFIPFCPFIDFLFFFQVRPENNEKITKEMIQEYSMEWLKVCDAVYLVPGWEESEGTQKEIRVADELGIPVIENMKTLKDYWKFP